MIPFAENTEFKNELERIRDELKQKTEEIETLRLECEKLAVNCEQLKQLNEEIERNAEIKISSLGVSESCIREEITYLKTQNDEMKVELVRKDETTEKEYLNMKHIENELKEELALVQNELKIKEASLSENDGALQQLIADKDAEITKQKSLIVALEQKFDALAKERDEVIAREREGKANADASNAQVQRDWESAQKEMEKHLATIQTLQKTIDENSSQIERLRSDVKNAQDAVGSGQQLLNEKDSILDKFQTEAAEQLAKIVELNAKLAQVQSEFVHMRDNTVQEKDQHIAKLSQDIEELTNSITELSAAKASSDQELSSKIDGLRGAEAKNLELQNMFDLERELNNDFRQQINTINNCSKTLESDFSKDLNEKANEIEKLKVAANENTNQSIALAKEKDMLTERLADTRLKLEKSEAWVAELSRKLAESDETVDASNNQIHKLTARADELAIENANGKAKAAELQSALDASRDTNDKRDRGLKDSQQKIDQQQIHFEQKCAEIERVNKIIEELTAKLQALEQSAAGRADKLAKLEVEYGDLQRKHAVIEEKCEQLAAEKASMQQNLHALQSSSTDTSTEIIRLSDELKAKQKAYNELNDTFNANKLSLEKRLHESQQNLSARTAQWERVKDEMESLTVQKIDRENELNLELSKIKEAYENEVEALKNEIDALKLSFKDDKEKLINGFHERDAIEEGIRNDLKMQVDNLQNTLKNLTKTAEKLGTQLEEKDTALQRTLENVSELETKLNQEIEKTKQKEEKSQKMIGELTDSNSTIIQDLSDQVSEKLLQNNALEEKMVALQNEMQALTKVNAALEQSLSEKSKTLDETSKQLQNENEYLATENARLEAKFAELTEVFRDTEDEQVDLVNKTIEYQTQIANLTEKVKEMDTIKAVIVQRDNTLAEQKTQIHALTAEIDIKSKQLNDKNAANAQTLSKLEIELKEADNKLIEANASHKNVESQLKSTIDDFDKYKSDAEQAKAEIENLIKTAVSESSEKDVVIKSLEDKITQLTTSVNLSDDLKNELNDKSDELKQKESSITELNNAIETLRTECAAKDTAMAQINNEKGELDKRLGDELQQKTAEVSVLNDRLQSNEKLVADQTEQIRTLTAAQETSVTENVELKQKIEDATSQLEKVQKETQSKLTEIAKTTSSQSDEVAKLLESLAKLETEKKREIEEITLKMWDGEEKVKELNDQLEKRKDQQRNTDELDSIQHQMKTRQTELLLTNKKLEGEILSLKVNLKEKDRLLVVASSSTTTPKQLEFVTDVESGAQISFLNSIIADMQKKNEALKAQIESADLFK